MCCDKAQTLTFIRLVVKIQLTFSLSFQDLDIPDVPVVVSKINQLILPKQCAVFLVGLFSRLKNSETCNKRTRHCILHIHFYNCHAVLFPYVNVDKCCVTTLSFVGESFIDCPSLFFRFVEETQGPCSISYRRVPGEASSDQGQIQGEETSGETRSGEERN